MPTARRRRRRRGEGSSWRRWPPRTCAPRSGRPRVWPHAPVRSRRRGASSSSSCLRRGRGRQRRRWRTWESGNGGGGGKQQFTEAATGEGPAEVSSEGKGGFRWRRNWWGVVLIYGCLNMLAAMAPFGFQTDVCNYEP
ncbi:unnamed protein product, partial [Musa acuminata var. zebrina]